MGLRESRLSPPAGEEILLIAPRSGLQQETVDRAVGAAAEKRAGLAIVAFVGRPWWLSGLLLAHSATVSVDALVEEEVHERERQLHAAARTVSNNIAVRCDVLVGEPSKQFKEMIASRTYSVCFLPHGDHGIGWRDARYAVRQMNVVTVPASEPTSPLHASAEPAVAGITPNAAGEGCR